MRQAATYLRLAQLLTLGMLPDWSPAIGPADHAHPQPGGLVGTNLEGGGGEGGGGSQGMSLEGGEGGEGAS